MGSAVPPRQHVYNALFPCYIEVCAVTQLHQTGAKPGGWGGHATLFVNRIPSCRIVWLGWMNVRPT